MGWNMGLTAIKTRDSEKALDIASEFYSRHKLILVEEKIGDRTSKYTTGKLAYKNIQDYEEKEYSELKGNMFTSDFDYFSNPSTNPEWCIFFYNKRLAKLTPIFDSDLSELLSNKLQTIVLDYYKYGVSTMECFWKYSNGHLEDRMGSGELNVHDTRGYFEQFQDRQFDSFDEFYNKVIHPFCESIGFVPDVDNLIWKDNSDKRPMYLKGDPHNLESYLKAADSVFLM